MERAILHEIDDIRQRMRCRKGFTCVTSGYNKLCKAKDVGLEHHLLCLESFPELCEFSLCLEKEHYCACPLRVYLTKNLQK